MKICSVLLQSAQYALQHDFAWVTDEADRSVVLALLQVAFLWKCDDQGLSPRGWPFSCLPDLVVHCHEYSDYCFSTYSDPFCWDVVSSTRLPFSSMIALQPPFLCEG